MSAQFQVSQIYRIIEDYEALQDGFADRIEELNTTQTEIDAAGGMTRGNTNQLLTRMNAGDYRPTGKRRRSRSFGWETLGGTLKGTGLALALIVDDARFAKVKGTLLKRRRKNLPSIVGQSRPTWLFTKDKAREMRGKWWSGLTDAQRKKHQRKAQRGQAASRRKNMRQRLKERREKNA
jgi:hypothetical protein